MAEIDSVIDAYFDAELLRLGHGLREALLEGEFAESQIEVPLEFGPLLESGTVSEVVVEDGVASVAIGYGNGDARGLGIYAIVQHERLDYNHPNGRNAKYIEGPVLRGAGTIMKRAAEKAS